MTIYTHKKTRERYKLLKEGIPVTDSDIKLVQYAPADQPSNQQLMLEQQWHQVMHKPLHALECRHCFGSANDPARPIKPCPECFGSGWQTANGEQLTNDSKTADELKKINLELAALRQLANRVDVIQLIKNTETAAIAQSEQQWRAGDGLGPNGQRYTGD